MGDGTAGVRTATVGAVTDEERAPLSDEQRAQRYFDESISISLVQDGMTEEGIAHLRQKYTQYALENPAALEVLRATYPD